MGFVTQNLQCFWSKSQSQMFFFPSLCLYSSLQTKFWSGVKSSLFGVHRRPIITGHLAPLVINCSKRPERQVYYSLLQLVTLCSLVMSQERKHNEASRRSQLRVHSSQRMHRRLYTTVIHGSGLTFSPHATHVVLFRIITNAFDVRFCTCHQHCSIDRKINTRLRDANVFQKFTHEHLATPICTIISINDNLPHIGARSLNSYIYACREFT